MEECCPYDQMVCVHVYSYPRSQAIGEMAWQLLRVQTVYGCNVKVIAVSLSTSQYWIGARYNFQQAFLLIEATVCC